jgi:monovalent cation:proton antiporter-2 (CPA2) family protein
MAHQSLFVAAFVYLLAAVISVPIAKRLGLSSVLGYLVAGMAIGPFALGLVGEEGSDVMHFAEFGVVLMLFLIGLELQPSLLWRLRGSILGLGGVQVGVTTLVVFLIALACGLNWQMSLAVGMALSLSSTAIVLQSLQEKGLTKTPGGQGAFSVLLFQDVSVIPMLAALPLLATIDPSAGGHGDHSDGHDAAGNAFQQWLSHQPAWMTTLLTLAAVVAIILAGRYAFQPLLAMVARTRVREAFVALGLLLVIGIALLMSFLGVSPALGTFLAGVVLANSEYRHELEADIDPFKGLLLGVFFISVGASIDFSLIAAKPLVVLGIVVGLIVVKAVVLFAVGWSGKLGLDQRWLFTLALAQGGEFAFVLFGVATSEGVLSGPVVQVLIAAVAISMALTPLLLIVEEKFIRPHFGIREKDDREADAMDEDAPVILAGIGRFGNYVARLLRAQGIEVTVIDNDPDYIDFLRKIGMKAFYGDAVRHDLLESAGADKARLLIIALDSEEKVNRLVEVARKHFPQLKVMARAISRPHQHELIDGGIDYTIHQHAGSAIHLGEQALRCLGFRAHRAARLAKRFRDHDTETVEMLAGIHRDEKKYVSRARERLADLERMFQSDREQQDVSVDHAWDVEQLREDTAEDGKL